MITKILEVRDRATFIPVIAVQMRGHDVAGIEQWYLERCGYGYDYPQVLVALIGGGVDKAYTDPYKWGDRTMLNAHLFIAGHFDALKTGDVVDVAHILGETAEPKKSERMMQG
jgi:hypothetical protein